MTRIPAHNFAEPKGGGALPGGLDYDSRCGAPRVHVWGRAPLWLMDKDLGRSRSNHTGGEIASSSEGITSFWRWYGSSVFADHDGRPLVFFHGSTGQFNIFDLELAGRRSIFDPGVAGPGFYFGCAARARLVGALFAEDGRGFVYPAYLKVERPYVFEDRTGPDGDKLPRLDPFGCNPPTFEDRAAFRDRIRAAGYDGVVIVANKLIEQVVVFDPHQIKSAEGNCGTFDPHNPDIFA